MIAYANPLRTIAGDAAGLTELVRTIDGPVVLVGHSYGGAVITNVAADAGEIPASSTWQGSRSTPARAPPSCRLAPGWTLAETLQTVPLPDGGVRHSTSRPRSSTTSSAPTCPNVKRC